MGSSSFSGFGSGIPTVVHKSQKEQVLLKIRQSFSGVPEEVRYQLQLVGGCVTQASRNLAAAAPALTVKALFGAKHPV